MQQKPNEQHQQQQIHLKYCILVSSSCYKDRKVQEHMRKKEGGKEDEKREETQKAEDFFL